MLFSMKSLLKNHAKSLSQLWQKKIWKKEWADKSAICLTKLTLKNQASWKTKTKLTSIFDDEAEDDGEDFTHDLEQDHDEDEGEAHEEIEDAVIRIEDKLDQLMAEFEEIMGGKLAFGDEGEEDYGDFGSEDEMDEDMMMENITLHKVPVTHGDNGSNTKNPVAFNSGQAGMDSCPVKFSGSAETVPTSPKKPSDYLTKGEGNLPGAGNFKNVPGKNNFKDKGDAAPKPKHGDDGSNFRSPVAESRRPARRPSR